LLQLGKTIVLIFPVAKSAAVLLRFHPHLEAWVYATDETQNAAVDQVFSVLPQVTAALTINSPFKRLSKDDL
jgi:hypothetical protein